MAACAMTLHVALTTEPVSAKKIPSSAKTADGRNGRLYEPSYAVCVECTLVTYGLEYACQGLLGVIQCTYLKIGPYLKAAHRRPKRTKSECCVCRGEGRVGCCRMGWSGICTTHLGTFDLERARSFGGHSVHLCQTDR